MAARLQGVWACPLPRPLGPPCSSGALSNCPLPSETRRRMTKLIRCTSMCMRRMCMHIQADLPKPDQPISCRFCTRSSALLIDRSLQVHPVMWAWAEPSMCIKFA